jgi:2-keto-3-deoxy-L-rhamnonate aldolase RhmA
MKPNRYRQAIAEGRVPVGHMVWEFGTRGLARMLEGTGLDFVIFDMEHSGFEIERVFDLIAYAKASSFAPFVRVPEAKYHFLARLMDGGALGVMIGNVETAETARYIVDSVKFAPLGRRGVGLGTSHTDFTVPDPVGYFNESNESTVVICQIESPKGVANAEAIAATPGVDILWVGHFDLSQSMGIPGQFQHPEFLANLERVVAAARKHGKRLGIQPGTPEYLDQWMNIGFDVISWSVDTAIYRSALMAGVQQVHNRAGNRT